MVVPVPWRLAELLKLLTNVLPSTSLPMECVTNAMPYGLTSPFAGTVEAMLVTAEKCDR